MFSDIQNGPEPFSFYKVDCRHGEASGDSATECAAKDSTTDDTKDVAYWSRVLVVPSRSRQVSRLLAGEGAGADRRRAALRPHVATVTALAMACSLAGSHALV
ncbi:hypothetical protein GQ600_14343 [Phytophthora cactorum]|nr:hypothetical protein GQ600_14343 [Phytophthora cactorum]